MLFAPVPPHAHFLPAASEARSRAARSGCLLLLVAATALLAGCSLSTIGTALVPRAGYTTRSDLAYGPLPRQTLDVYRPRGLPTPRPTVVFFYGGRWQSGSKEQYRLLAYTLTQRGYVVVIPDYRLHPQVEFPTFVEDAAHAVRWVRDHIREHGGDPDQVVLMGHSAGAHIAMLLTLDERYLRAVNVDPGDAIAGTVGLAGPYDFLPFEDQDVRDLMGPAEQWPRRSRSASWTARSRPCCCCRRRRRHSEAGEHDAP